MAHELLSVHDYWTEPGRFDLVDGWMRARGQRFPENLIPPLAVLVKRSGVPVAFLCAYQAVGIGVAIIDWMVSAPGQTAAETRAAMLFGLKGLRMALVANGYGVALTYTLPAAARTLEREGWTRSGDFVQLVTTLN